VISDFSSFAAQGHDDMRWFGLVGMLALMIIGGCGKHPAAPAAPELVPLDQVPETVMKAAREKLPDVRFESAWKAREEGQEVYEVRGKTGNGKTFEVEVTPDGTVVKVE
jgi:hypothetical protein